MSRQNIDKQASQTEHREKEDRVNGDAAAAKKAKCGEQVMSLVAKYKWTEVS